MNSVTSTSRRQPGAAQVAVMLPHAVRDRLPLAMVVAVVVALLAVMTGALWPSLQNSFGDLPTSITDALNTVLAGSDLTTPTGWMTAEVLSVVAPVGALAVAIVSVARAVAGEEQGKTLGVLLSAPVTRSTFLLTKAAAMVAHVLVVVAGLAVGMAIGSQIGGLGLTATGIVGAGVHLGALGVFFGAVALLVSAATGDRRLTSAIAAGMGVVAFALHAFLPLSASLADGARLSPWYYYAGRNPLVNGPDLSDVMTLVVGAAVLTVLAVAALRRRDLRG